MLREAEKHPEVWNAKALRAHVFAHRYAMKRETFKDRLTWHVIVLIEWSHGLFASVAELAWWNGLGGLHGRSNWCRDKLNATPALYAVMPDCMKAPWQTHRAELRLIDVAARDKAEFEAYLHEYSEKGGLPVGEQRFFEPRLVQSGDVRLSNRSPVNIMRGMLNYIGHDSSYNEAMRNCQTFAADFFAFLTGLKGVQPFQAFCRPFYKPRPYLFFYDPPGWSLEDQTASNRENSASR